MFYDEEKYISMVQSVSYTHLDVYKRQAVPDEGIRWDGGFFLCGRFLFWRDDVFFLGKGLIDTAYLYLLL